MRLLFDPDPPYVRWCREADGAFRAGRGPLGPRWNERFEGDVPVAQASSISYRLHHGGESFPRPVTRLSPDTLAAVRDCVRLLPEHNGLAYELMRRMLELAPGARHLVLCDTAFFAELPLPARTYAVPAALRAGAMRRHGGCGLLHQWAWERTRELAGPGVSRLVSIQLGDHPNLAAIRDGRSVETTLGFTPVEGLPSMTSCGDIDTSVVFELQSSGLSLSEINELLSARSGFRALLGRPCGWRDLARESGDPDQALARRMLVYGLVRYVGAFAAVLDGVDAVSFACQDPQEGAPLIRDVCRELAFLGLDFQPGGPGGVKAVVLKEDLWRIMSRRAADAEKENDHGNGEEGGDASRDEGGPLAGEVSSET